MFVLGTTDLMETTKFGATKSPNEESPTVGKSLNCSLLQACPTPALGCKDHSRPYFLVQDLLPAPGLLFDLCTFWYGTNPARPGLARSQKVVLQGRPSGFSHGTLEFFSVPQSKTQSSSILSYWGKKGFSLREIEQILNFTLENYSKIEYSIFICQLFS